MYALTPNRKFWVPSINTYHMLFPQQQLTSNSHSWLWCCHCRRDRCCRRHRHCTATQLRKLTPSSLSAFVCGIGNNKTIDGDVHNRSTETTINMNNTILCARSGEIPPSCKAEEVKKNLTELRLSCLSVVIFIKRLCYYFSFYRVVA